ncbi:sensor histidine kinase [Rhodococcus sp. 14-2470-1a]|uniref:sensor histidine kinase n=1 Tax=Rhodococcus sp. 14-2470-1a TaxID=2023150 RepID=UPI0015C60CE3|nr:MULTISPECIES: histidine kinase [unclassified Rhodococcus (in: high G+C Gram-positive bacteria)]
MAQLSLSRLRWWPHLPSVVVAVVGCTYLALGMPEGDARDVEAWLPGGAVLLQAALLLCRLRFPTAVLAACTALDAVVIIATGGEIGAGALGVAIAAYTLAREMSTRHSWIALIASATVTFAISVTALAVNPQFTSFSAVGSSALRVMLQVALPAVLADAARSRAKLLRAYRDRADAAERDREATVARALTEERTALARELHDIAAHHVTAIVVSIQAAGVLLRTANSAAAQPYLRTAIDEAGSTLDQLRATVGLLRDHDEETALSFVPDDVAGLVAAVRNRGVRVDYHGRDDTPLGPIERATVYRMIQESLANAIQHAPGADCTVDIVSDPGGRAVVVTVTNGPPATASIDSPVTSGLGLIGMAERAHLIGAALETGAAPDGGWQNRLVITPGRLS